MSESNNLNVSLNDIYHAALEAEKQGVPVNWKEMYMKGVTIANNYIANQEALMEQMTKRIEELVRETEGEPQ